MYDQSEDLLDPERSPQRNCTEQLLTYNVPTDDVKNINVSIRKEICDSLISGGLFPQEQKGRRKDTRSTGKLLYIDHHIFNESKTRRKNLAMAL